MKYKCDTEDFYIYLTYLLNHKGTGLTALTNTEKKFLIHLVESLARGAPKPKPQNDAEEKLLNLNLNHLFGLVIRSQFLNCHYSQLL